MKSQINDIFFLLALLYFAANLKAASLLCQVFFVAMGRIGMTPLLFLTTCTEKKGVATPVATPILKLKYLLAKHVPCC
jgi:hypothetical protein